MSWLLTGGSGQLATTLAQLLDREGISFVAPSKSELDITQTSSIDKMIDLKPSLIVNCAAYTAVDKAESESEAAYSVNATGARNVTSAAKELKAQLIHISTDYVFSGESFTPWKVDSPTSPSTQYGKSKLAGEEAVQEIYPECSWILRTAWLYSPFGKNFVKTIIKKAISEKNELRVVDDQLGQPTSTFDVAERIIELERGSISPGIYHATNSGQASWFEFTQEIFQLSGVSTDRITSVSSAEYVTPAKRPKFSVLDHSRWIELGMSGLRPWEGALRDVYPSIRTQVERELRNG
jgi:dTDP-4-dehydrorhamnose reductase